MILTDFPEVTTRNDRCATQGYESALVSNIIEKSRFFDVPELLDFAVGRVGSVDGSPDTTQRR